MLASRGASSPRTRDFQMISAAAVPESSSAGGGWAALAAVARMADVVERLRFRLEMLNVALRRLNRGMRDDGHGPMHSVTAQPRDDLSFIARRATKESHV